MRVFIWVQYGEVDVYPAETEEQLDNLFNSIVDCLDDWGLESEISKAERFLEKNNRSPEHLVKAVQYLLGKIHISSHEQFERGTGFKHMREAIEQSEKQEPVWIGLTDDDIESIICDMIDRKEYGATDIARLAEQLLKEKNHG